jgi:hypothetical protein
MRRVLVLCALIALLLPAFAAAGTQAGDDGILVVKEADGTIGIVARGSMIGSCDYCTVTIDDPNPNDGAQPVVNGTFDLQKDLTDTKTRWRGTSIRFRAIGGFVRMIVRGVGINLSVVAHGQGWVDGDPTPFDGTWSLDGGDRRSMPDDRIDFWLGTPPTQTG